MARSLLSLVVAGAGLFVTLAAAVPAGAAVLHTTDVNAAGGQPLCIDIAGGSTQAGADVILYPCHGGANQEFTFHRGNGEIRSALGNLCLDVDRGGAWAGNRVQMWTCNGSDAQRFAYDPRTRRIAFRARPSLCLDLPYQEARARLWDCNDTPAQRFAVSTPYGNRRFDELTFLTAHNAFANYEDSRWAAPNQRRGIGRALRDGVRGLMLDIHSFESGTARCIASFGSDCYDRDVYLCHGNCGGVPGIGYALPRQSLGGALRTVVQFLDANPDELVTVFLEDYVSSDDLRSVLDGVPGLRGLQFDPYAWNVRQNRWPRASDMVDTNRRLLIISDRGDKRGLGVGYGPDLTVENYWSLGNMGNDRQCVSRWDSIPLDRTDSGFSRLFVMNHFRSIATVVTAAIDNGHGNLTDRIESHCVPSARRKPNFVAVDFYDTGDALGLAAEVDDASAILFTHGGFSGRAQLLGAGRHELADLGIGNDMVSSLKVLSGTSVVLYEHSQLGGRTRTFTSSADSVGDFNDLASSAVVRADNGDVAQHRIFDGDFNGDGKADKLVYHGSSGDLWLGISTGSALQWRAAGNIAGFGNLLDGRHEILTGDFNGDGKTDVLFYFNGDGHWWLGRSDGAGLSWGLASDTAGFGNLLGTRHRIYPGDWNGDGKSDVMFYFAGDGLWWMGLSDGRSLRWHSASNTSGFGDLLSGNHRIFTGDFTGDGKADVMFHFSGNGDWWLGASDGNALAWRRVSNSAGFGNLLDPVRALYTGDFTGDGKLDVMFHYAGNGDWWLGASDGNALAWRRVSNTSGFGAILGGSHRIVTGDFSGDGKTDVMFHFNGNGDWWLGVSDGNTLAWRRAGTTGGGNLLDPSRLIFTGDVTGDGKVDVMHYGSDDGAWTLGRSDGGSFAWSGAGNAASLGDLTR